MILGPESWDDDDEVWKPSNLLVKLVVLFVAAAAAVEVEVEEVSWWYFG